MSEKHFKEAEKKL